MLLLMNIQGCCFTINPHIMRAGFWLDSWLLKEIEQHVLASQLITGEPEREAIERNEIELFVMRCMDLESVIQSELSQKEKNKYRMVTHIYGIKKKNISKEIGRASCRERV